ncbi:protein yippee-like 4 isoform X2 [Trachypithecus francoisi]|uniref:protein yippee-like 4 isoform X2 n=1 Tax=Trachypithecus francoisi TaxID=54180 RepID=UPI00141B6CC4|nr:protein yippee-like 4 isoform X2 [Trachypithecus francoisi]
MGKCIILNVCVLPHSASISSFTSLATSFPPALPPSLHPCPALSFPQVLPISLATLPSSLTTCLSPCPPSPPRPSAPTPLAPSFDACPLPSFRPASCVSQPCSDVGGEGGWGGWMTHSVMMQFHNTQPHSPTDRGTERETTSAPPAAGQLCSPSLESPTTLPPPTPIPFPIEGAEREERRVSREIERLRERERDRRRSLEQTSRVNVGCGPAEQRLLLTGLHSVADIFCESCKTTLGWKYEQAFETSQKYKEGKYIIEMSHMVKDNGWD